ncbi:hypothetical protein C8R43DRAFT_1123998 [Mycena crocata]|nr:hypothetical protein C8R43DRAFT_1123998 [Mycena crocata]
MHHLLQLSFSLTYPLSLHLSSFRTTTTAAISFPARPANWERSPTWVRVYSTAKPPGTSTPRSDPPGGKINRPTPARPVANFRRVVADVDYYDYYIYRRPASRDKFQPPEANVIQPPRSGGDRDYGFIEAPRAGSNRLLPPEANAPLSATPSTQQIYPTRSCVPAPASRRAAAVPTFTLHIVSSCERGLIAEVLLPEANAWIRLQDIVSMESFAVSRTPASRRAAGAQTFTLYSDFPGAESKLLPPEANIPLHLQDSESFELVPISLHPRAAAQRRRYLSLSISSSRARCFTAELLPPEANTPLQVPSSITASRPTAQQWPKCLHDISSSCNRLLFYR